MPPRQRDGRQALQPELSRIKHRHEPDRTYMPFQSHYCCVVAFIRGIDSAGHSVLITGPTGAGKSWLACALAQYACRRGYSAVYQRVPRLQEELRIRHGSGAFGKWLLQLAKTDVLVLDDWGMGAIDGMTRSDLLEIIDDRAGNKATIITSQLPVEHWHAWIGDATIADAILDRVMQRNHRFTLTGDSLRAQRPKTAKKEKNIDPS